MTDKKDEVDFWSLFQNHQNGCGSIVEIVEHSKFQSRLGRMARGFDYSVFHGGRDWDDICQEISLRLFEEELNSKLRIPGNIETEEHFFNWLFVLARNHHYDAIRRRLAKKREALRDAKPAEEYEFPVWDGDHDRVEREMEEEAALNGFPDFIKRYSLARQWAIRRWMKNKSYRRIQKMLLRLGCTTSYVTIGNWINATIEDYSRYLEEPPETQRRTGT